MINFLFTILFAEMGLILTLLFGSPLRTLLIVAMDWLKQGRGPLVARTVAATILVVFSSILYSVLNIQKRARDTGVVNPTDEVVMAERLLEASLMGFSLFLAMMTDRLHYYVRELYLTREELRQLQRSVQEYGNEKTKKREVIEEAKAPAKMSRAE